MEEVVAMPGASSLVGLAVIIAVLVGVAFLVGLFYLAGQGAARHDDSDGRYRRRY